MLAALVLALAAAPAAPAPKDAAAAEHLRKRLEHLALLEIPLDEGARTARRARRDRLHREVLARSGAGIAMPPPSKSNLFFSGDGVFFDALGAGGPVTGEKDGFELHVHEDLFLALGALATADGSLRAAAEDFHRRLRAELVPALRRGDAEGEVRLTPPREALAMYLVVRWQGTVFLREAEVVYVAVRLRRPEPGCCVEPPILSAWLRARVRGGLPEGFFAPPSGIGPDGALLVVGGKSPAAKRLRSLPEEASPRVVTTRDEPFYLATASLDVDGDGTIDAWRTRTFDCIDRSCAAAHVAARGGWRLVRFGEGERYCPEGC